MRRFLPAFLFLIVALAFGTWALRGAGLLGGLDPAEVRDVPAGHQEVAWIAPATSTDAWERLVAAVRQTEQQWSRLPGAAPLRVSYENAFLEVTAGVPEINVHLAGNDNATL